ncbi:hypothetical protein PV10_06380 [Exophiala mesophila]|uniref:C3H1-type domain-containing protein n=1 Tax=Exophiala mesophila TaxID=212818 RepID=A0A0D1ZD76_EXOME|nr:uncharacterized protein PV10_06380 [Exophiala mesophila]KIV91889.1 hypothetical protein PV10_06380 [Exophiala mesophila]
MSNQPFTFPPPPPPPPKPTVDPTQQRNNDFTGGRGGYRGWRGDSFRGQGHNRGGGRGNHRGGGGGRNHTQHYGQNTSSRPYNNNNYSQPTHSYPPQKRTHNTAFTPAPNARPRPLAPPPVPSFNATIPHLLPNKPILTPPDHTPTPTKSTQPTKPPAKKNLLGLTPSLPGDSSSSEDEDEEHHLSTTVNSTSQGQGYSFTHNGRVATLRTAADIQAWIAERRKNFPTAAKAEAAKKEREEKKKKWLEEKEEQRRQREAKKVERQRKYEEEKQARQSARQAAVAEKQGAPNGAGSKEGGGTSNAGPKNEVVDSPAEKLRRRAEKAERALKRAEEALRQVRLKQAQAQAQAQAEANGMDGVTVSSQSAIPDTAIDPDATSSSGSSDSDTGTDSDSEIEGHLDISSFIGSHPDSDSDLESNPGDNDNDDDNEAPPETISTKDPSLLSHTNPLSSDADADATKALTRNSRPCKNLVQRGRCHFGSSCRYSHDLDQVKRNEEVSRTRGRGGKTIKGKSGVATKPERRKGLFQVMVDKEEEERRKNIIDAIFLLREKGMLDEPEQKTEPDSVAGSIGQQPVEVSNSN